jgi:hypothetical protein
MSRTKRKGTGKTAQRVVPLLVGGAVAVTSVVLLSGAPATATAKTVTVSFTADVPSPSSVTISPGDTVVYRNDVDPADGGLLGSLTDPIKSVTVTVTNAAQSPFDLEPGQARALTYTQPVVTTYTADYRTTTLLLLPGRTVTTTGTVTVKSSSTGGAPAASPAPQPPRTTAPAAPAPQSAGTSGQGAGQAGATAGQVQPQVDYTPQEGNAAASQVPRGGSAAGGDRGDDAASVPGGTDGSAGPGSGSGAQDLPQIGSADQKQAAQAMSRASSDSAAGSLGMPSILAVVLLSMVSAGLVRTIMVRHSVRASLA